MKLFLTLNKIVIGLSVILTKEGKTLSKKLTQFWREQDKKL